MKRVLEGLLCLSICLLMVRCDKIEEPYLEAVNSEAGMPIPYFEEKTDFIHKYLLEDFTGHRCVNCTKAHKAMREMQEKMGDTLVCIGIHTGPQSEPDDPPYTADYRTGMGNEISTHFGVSALPSGIINRRDFDRDGSVDIFKNSSLWSLMMDSIHRTQAEIGLQIKDTNFSKYPDSIYISVKINYLKENSKNLRLYVVLLEDGIISAQKFPTGDSLNYVHNHVLRTNIGPIKGSALKLKNGSEHSEILSYALYRKSIWKWENCSYVAFVCDADTEEVLQVEKFDIN